MDKPKSISMKTNKGLNSKSVKPSRYIDMVVEALQTLRDRKGSMPKNIVGYIADSYNLTADKKTASSNVYRALKQGIAADLILKNSDGLYKLSAKGERKIPARRHHRRRRKGRRKGKKRKKGRKRRKGRRKKRGGRKKKRRSRRRSRRGKHRRRYEEFEEQPRRKRKKNHSDDD